MKHTTTLGTMIMACSMFHSCYPIQAIPKDALLITQNHVAPQQVAVIFDLGNVLIQTNKRVALWQLGPRNLFSYLIKNRSISRMKEQFYTTLNRIAGSNGNCCGAKDPDGQVLPELCVKWLRGDQPNAQLLHDVEQAIRNHPEWFNSPQEQQVLASMAQFTFDPNRLIMACKPIYEMVRFAKQCKEKGYQLHILSNWDSESYQLLVQKYPTLFELFDTVIISGQVHTIKPDPAIFSYITKQIPAHRCIFIDDQQENLDAAAQLGMHTILAASKRAFMSTIPDMQAIRTQFARIEQQLGLAVPQSLTIDPV